MGQYMCMHVSVFYIHRGQESVVAKATVWFEAESEIGTTRKITGIQTMVILSKAL